MALLTAGYEGLDIDRFLTGLKNAGVDKVIDVRQMPVSRKKGFSKTSFAEKLMSSGIDYEHIKALGCPKSIRDQYKQDGDWANYTKHFRAYIATQTDVVRDVAAEAVELNACLICFEADVMYCHRRFVAEASKQLNPALTVKHLAIKKEIAVAV
ncbi:DUF488 domain-containing protein [Halomonas sp. ISL-60]|uniref:DUF488 domain-containing protein n=1 Tax=Halomonas sp. ISL-56 TaxID=2819149 RepID=UPI001BEB03D4|nr:DUF488 domain-containing protein [Halomonas sp. ISL-56]MBT2772635.1 DUF488 domain-containing protein [Halomonas sp. ISL-60]MBT2802023.1 DUF488 domain-containing protein [Halomonas sp. ISL-56]